MPLEAAADGITLAEQALANMLANSAAFRSFCGAADANAALKRIHFDALPQPEGDAAEHSADELKKLRPFAIVYTAAHNGYKLTRVATETFAESGTLEMLLEDNLPASIAADGPRLMRRFKNQLGAILRELQTLAWQPGYLAVNSFDVVALAREAEDERENNGDNVFAFLSVPWGQEQ